jgi:SpoVK/Ycf46/Vps4 family AAA+-type ATPase
VRALFAGASGTGKTLAARILAAELGLDLYRVDLASVVSKYIGETEKNLSRLFARAEEQDVILLLDEGDSLLTARTDVRSSNDRYANMETNYLLQRLEHYQGIFLVTTNTPGRIDSAFQRRMDVYIEFNPPNAAQRYDIWRLHCPAQHALEDGFMRTVAARCNLSGGQIRNAALHATVLAVDVGQPLSHAHLTEGIAREYRKMGAASPL